MLQISKRVAATASERTGHIRRLNEIGDDGVFSTTTQPLHSPLKIRRRLPSGRQIPQMHTRYQQFMQTNRAKSNVYDAEEQANAILDLLNQIKHMRNLLYREELFRFGSGRIVTLYDHSSTSYQIH